MSKKIYFALLASILTLAGFFVALALTPSIRNALRLLVLRNERQVLAKVEGDLSGQGDRYVIIKVKGPDTLSLEVYEANPQQKSQSLLRRIVLNEKRDGHFNFRGQATNLVLTDVNSDNVLEIIAPAFDENLIPRLNVFSFDPTSKSFSRMGPEDSSSL